MLLIAAAAIVAGRVIAASERDRATSGAASSEAAPSAAPDRPGTPGTSPARDYVPSEKISADKTVSFPTDI
jgi:hypothetical protein